MSNFVKNYAAILREYYRICRYDGRMLNGGINVILFSWNQLSRLHFLLPLEVMN